MRTRRTAGPRAEARGITLIEILIVVVILGIAGAMVIPSMAQVGVLRIQSALRTVVSDLTYTQSDAMATQARRAVVFGLVAQQNPGTGAWEIVGGNGYVVYAPLPGSAAIDLLNDWMPDPENAIRPFFRRLDHPDFGGATIAAVDFNGGPALIFDELGGPVEDMTSDNPGSGGSLRLTSPTSTYDILVEPFTGRVTVARVGP